MCACANLISAVDILLILSGISFDEIVKSSSNRIILLINKLENNYIDCDASGIVLIRVSNDFHNDD